MNEMKKTECGFFADTLGSERGCFDSDLLKFAASEEGLRADGADVFTDGDPGQFF
jgi:hypothetical protein